MRRLRDISINRPYLIQEIIASLLNIWVFIVIVYSLNVLSSTILNSVFYGTPKVVILSIIGFCTALSIISLFVRTEWIKTWSVLLSTLLYLWIAFSTFRFSLFSLTGGTFLILAARYAIMFFNIKAQGYNDRNH